MRLENSIHSSLAPHLLGDVNNPSSLDITQEYGCDNTLIFFWALTTGIVTPNKNILYRFKSNPAKIVMNN
jgi:hypothetical protein